MYAPSSPPGWGYPTYPPPPPPPKKRSPVVIGLLATGCVFFASCVGMCGYAVIHAETPEGKREAAAQRAKDKADVEHLVTQLRAIRDNLPASVDDEQKCPAGVAGFHPVVDSIWLSHVGEPRSVWSTDAKAAALTKVRASEFSDKVLEAASSGDAGVDQLFGPASDAHILADKKYFAVLLVDDLLPPEIEGSSFVSGELDGAVVIVDVATAKPICHAPVSAQNSDNVEYGGGVRIKVKGIPGPKIGDKSLEEAVQKDFTKNVEAQMRLAMTRIGAR